MKWQSGAVDRARAKTPQEGVFVPSSQTEVHSGLAAVMNHIHKGVLVAVVGVVFLTLLAQKLQVPADNLQTALFPIVVGLIWFLPKDPARRLPLLLLLGALLCWAGSALAIRGYLPINVYQTPYVITRLQGDPEDKIQRAIFHRFNQVALSFKLPQLGLVVRSNLEQPAEWAETRGVAALLQGETKTLTVGFPRKGVQTREVGAGILPTPLKVVSSLPVISIGVRSSESFGHFLPWFLAALNTPAAAAEEKLSLLRMASVVAAPNSEYGLRFIARFFLGTETLLSAVQGSDVQEGALRCALSNVEAALRQVRGRRVRWASGEIAAALNNGAVARLLLAESREDLEVASDWFRQAAKIRSGSRPALAAKVAAENMRRLAKVGFLVVPLHQERAQRGRKIQRGHSR